MKYRTALHRVQRERGKASDHTCSCGNVARQWKYDGSDPRELKDARCGRYSLDTSRYRPICRRCGVVGYRAAHARVAVAKGSARMHACVDCGAGASHWSYVGNDPDARIDSQGLTYSLQPECYAARCVRCHWLHDGTGGSPGPRGASSPNAKLTDEQAEWIRKSFTGKRGEMAALARQFEVSHRTIQKIVHRISYRDPAQGRIAN